MAKRFVPVEFEHLLFWIFNEYFSQGSIFGIPSSKFYIQRNKNDISIFDQSIETPVGPAAGPHTQLAQNIISTYLVGGRFIELKTVQVLDSIKVTKPCIDAEDECYNVEWSQELNLEQSFDEYLKAWIIIHILKQALKLSDSQNSFIFNMSLGYDFQGITSNKMDEFINSMKDASGNKLFEQYKQLIESKSFYNKFLQAANKHEIQNEEVTFRFKESFSNISNISPNISGSATLSTMHGCPPDEIEKIAEHLIQAKHLHTFIKLNPTLLGRQKVENILAETGFNYLNLNEKIFENDLIFSEAEGLASRLKSYAGLNKKEFGIKLSNTLGVKNNRLKLPGTEMYMSGRALYPLTINLAYELAKSFEGDIKISFSGGADTENIKDILAAGIFPVTMVTDLLKPGGYLRLFEAAKEADKIIFENNIKNKIHLNLLKNLAEHSITDINYKKEKRNTGSIKIQNKLEMFDCFIAPCQINCPIEQDVSDYIRLIEEKKFKEACEVIAAKNPLPNITSYICDHQCTAKCTRWDYDSPLLIRELKKEAVEKGYKQFVEHFKKNRSIDEKKIKAAIIGAGPAGLSTAYFLAHSGFDVTIFEQNKKAGGVVSQIIPEFRIPGEIIDKDVEFIISLGVKINYNSDKLFDIQSLRQKGYKYFFIGIGASQPVQLNLNKSDGRVLTSIEMLRSFNKKENLQLGKSVAVIGGGNSAMDSARAAARVEGVKNVFIIYRRTKEFMPADKEEFEAAISDGIIFKELLTPVTFENNILKCQKMKLGKIDFDGRRKTTPLENEFENISINTVISAIGENVESELLIKNNIFKDSNGKLIVNSKTCETNIENVYVGGDAYRGPSTVAQAIADAKRAADNILFKEGKILFDKIHSENYYNVSERIRDIQQRKGKVSDYHPENKIEEAKRCLGCNLICNKCVEVCPNRANIALDSETIGNTFNDAYQIIHLDGLCNECGNCQTFCPYNDAPYKTKMTIFWSEKDFRDSTNSGFFIKRNVNGNHDVIQVQYRLNSETGKYLSSADGVMYTINPSSISNELERLSKTISNIVKFFPFLLSPSENHLL